MNLSTARDIIYGGTSVSAVYIGSNLVWSNQPSHDYSEDYLTIESTTNNNTISWKWVGTSPIQNTIYWSTDMTNWTSAIASTANSSVTLATLNSGDKIYLKGSNNKYANSNNAYNCFDASDKFIVYGNIMSLLYDDNFVNQTSLGSYTNVFQGIFRSNNLEDASNLILPATTLTQDCYNDMFNGCTTLTKAPKLPATTLGHACYKRMFKGCTALTEAPQLPATTLANQCYNTMFNGCTALTEAPQLPATTLVDSCYQYMFQKCTSLVEAPELPATTLYYNCYQYMFQNCTSLTEAPQLPATTLVDYCYQYMFQNCTSLTEAPQLPATTLVDYCYHSMFRGCTALTEAPQLPATTLANRCYNQMFSGCTSLNYIKCLATDISASYCLHNWVSGVSATGTFVKDANATWQTGISGIPTNWTIVDV